MNRHLTHEIGQRGLTTLDMADKIASYEDRLTEADDARMLAMRGGPHRYTEGSFFDGWCDVCGVAKGVHL